MATRTWVGARGPRRARRGNYVMMLFVALMVVLGFGAISIDVAYMLMARAQAQAVADAASQAGIIVLRQTGDRAQAQDAAETIVAMNKVAGRPATLDTIQFGLWDMQAATPIFVPTDLYPNAVHVRVSHTGTSGVNYLLAKIWGYTKFDVTGASTSATRSVQLVMVLDVTGSWGERDFAQAREAELGALDLIAPTVSGMDEIAMTIFSSRYAWLYTPFTDLTAPGAVEAVRADWERLNIMSKAGTDADHFDAIDCRLNTGGLANNFDSPPGGCYPDMPREYTDEWGTDHSTGVGLAQQIYQERGGNAAYRAMIVVTDGRPNEILAANGTIRASQGYDETRWREFVGQAPRSEDQIRTATIAATQELWDTMRVHTWVVSLVEDDPMMPAMVRGDGYYVRTDDPTRLSGILAQIVSEMPLAIVE